MKQGTAPCLGWRVHISSERWNKPQKLIWGGQEGQQGILLSSIQGHTAPPTERHYSSLWHKLHLLFTSSYGQINQMTETKLCCISCLRNSKNIPKWETSPAHHLSPSLSLFLLWGMHWSVTLIRGNMLSIHTLLQK